MKKFLWMLALATGMAFALVPMESEAKRLGGARSSGMQRNTAPDKPPQNAPATPAATPNTPAAPAAAAAAAPKRSWMGPIAGLAAGLGLAALFSHLGWGDELANFVMLALLVIVAIVVIRMLMRRFGAAARPPLAIAAAAAARGEAARPAAPTRFVDERPGMQRDAPSPIIGSTLKPPLAVPGLPTDAASTVPALPASFDTPGFERLAKTLFIRMQAANDSADLNDLRSFTTPELFASLRLDLQDRADAAQTTDVVRVDARLVDFAEDGERQIVSVRFSGLIREEAGADTAPFDEIWHLVKPLDDSRSWAIAGVQQAQ